MSYLTMNYLIIESFSSAMLFMGMLKERAGIAVGPVPGVSYFLDEDKDYVVVVLTDNAKELLTEEEINALEPEQVHTQAMTELSI